MRDEQALAALREGDETGFRTLYDQYASKGLHYAQSILQNESDSEEAVQEAFCRLLKPLGKGKIEPELGGFGAVFFQTLRNHCIDMLRRRRLRTHVSLETVAEPGVTSPMPGHDASGIERSVEAFLETLPDRHADALKLKLKGGLSYAQIAAVLGCTRAQVRTWIYRARRSLEDRFRKEGLIDRQE
jgi:RNA polymerase sigma-70 factor (ECF subfamily)